MTKGIDDSIFRAYDIRGVFEQSLTEDCVYQIGKALGSFAQDHAETQMTIARDGRLSSPVLARALGSGIMATGCDVIDIGMVPTPLLYYATAVFDSHSGVMMTGSHNPPDYNGLKMVVNKRTLQAHDIQALKQRILAEDFAVGLGSYFELNVVERYINHVARNVHLSRPLKIVIDAGHGVTGMMAPELYRELGCEVIPLFCDVDGNFPDHHADPSQPENLQDLIRAVREEKADIGLAFDGDGDRLGVVTSDGEIIWPDRLLMLFAESVLQKYPHAKIIYDVKCTQHLAPLIESLQGEPIMWKTGHSLIKAKLAETKAYLAGEMSGHFFFNDRWYGFDDALYAGARLLEILSRHKQSSAEIFQKLPNSVNTPEMKINISDQEKFSLMDQLTQNHQFQDNEIITIDGLRINFKEGWGLVRPSNTTPSLILRFEAANEAVLSEIKTIFRAWLLSVKPDLEIPF